MEELLNKLIEKGWKPFGWKDIKRANNEGWFVCFVHKTKKRPWLSEVSYRELVSIDSGLWQFVCENGMVIEKENEIKMGVDIHSYDYISVEYRLIETSLKNEDEIEQFLLDNIKVGNEN